MLCALRHFNSSLSRKLISRKDNFLHRTLQNSARVDVVNNDGLLKSRPSDKANVVIIGGGVVGVSAAYHLAKAGVKEVVLLEKSELTSGSTWHAAGLVTYFHPGINIRKINYDSLTLYKQLEKETGQAVGLHTPGSLRLCTTPARVDEALMAMSRHRWQQAKQRLMEPKEIAELIPFLNMDQVLMGLWTPDDGHIDPNSLTMALAAGARLHGAEIYQHVEVTNTRLMSSGDWEIDTIHGTIRANRVVNASGFWGKEVARLAGIEVPLVPVHHQYLVTNSIPEVEKLGFEMPVIRDLEGSYYIRQERKGLLFGPYEAVDRMELCDDWVHKGVPPNFGKELFEPNVDRIMPNVEMVMDRFPVVRNAQITSVISGPITYNAENAPLLGPSAELPNYWIMLGFGYGIAQAGGAGKYIADWICNGEPTYDLIELDANRYGWWADNEYAIAKARETYGMNNALGFPREERFAGRPSNRGRCALFDLQVKNGAETGFHNGWEQPHWFARLPNEVGYKPQFRRGNWFSAMCREAEGVLKSVGLTNLTPFGKFEISGCGAADFLDKITSNKLPKVGRTCITHMLTPRGRVFSELTVTRKSENEFLAITGSGSELHDLQWLRHQQRHMSASNVNICNVTDSLGALSVAGPRSRDLMKQLVDNVNFESEAWPFLAVKNINIGGIDCLAIRISYTGELGWELYMKAEHTTYVYESLLSCGKLFNIIEFGSYAMNSLRLEKGFRMWGAEMNCDTNPLEAGLGSFIKLNKPVEFVGKAELSKLKQVGPKSRQLVFLKVESKDQDANGNESVFHKNQLVGNTTSGGYGVQCGYSMAFAYVPQYLSLPGTELEIDLFGQRIAAKVLPTPPFKVESVREREAAKINIR